LARIVALKLPDDVYRELERKAKRLGYSLVSDYVRDIIMRELGYKGEAAATISDVERIV
jgi:metal-responsive CopG/Arc/MetJ family transcriptional regulator